MSETTTEATAGTPAPTPKNVAEAALGKAGETPEQTIEALRAALAKANQEAKDNRLKAAELDQVKQSQMSDLERAQAEAKAASEVATKAQSEALRWRIAAKYGISDEDAETFLTATDEDGLIKQADRLRQLAATPTPPKPDRTQGGSGEALALNGDGIEAALRAKLGIA